MANFYAARGCPKGNKFLIIAYANEKLLPLFLDGSTDIPHTDLR
jgi:hypothetical protein